MFEWAFLGCGNIAGQVAREIAGERGMRIGACWNRTPARAERFAEQFGAAAYPTAEEAIAARGVRAAYLAMTANKHFDYIRLCLERGVPVLCEKPFTVNLREAEEAFALARQRGVYLAEAMWTWFNAPAHKVREWLRSGAIGAVRRVTAKYAERYIDIPRFSSPELLGGALVDIGVYPIRYAYELFGYPKAISCKGRVEDGVDHEEEITLTYDGFTAELSVNMDEWKGEEFCVEGEKGSIRVPFFHCAEEAFLSGEEEVHFEDKCKKYGTEFRRVSEEIAAGKKESALCPPEHTLDVMRILDECRRQMGLVYPSEK